MMEDQKKLELVFSQDGPGLIAEKSFDSIEIILIVIYAFLPDISYQFSGQDNSILLVDDVKFLNQVI